MESGAGEVRPKEAASPNGLYLRPVTPPRRCDTVVAPSPRLQRKLAEAAASVSPATIEPAFTAAPAGGANASASSKKKKKKKKK